MGFGESCDGMKLGNVIDERVELTRGRSREQVSARKGQRPLLVKQSQRRSGSWVWGPTCLEEGKSIASVSLSNGVLTNTGAVPPPRSRKGFGT